MASRVGGARQLLSTILVAAVLASCTAFRPVKVAELPGGLRDGDRVWLTLKDGKAADLTVIGLTGDAIRGSGGETVPFSDIDTIQVARLDTKETLGRTVMGLIVAFACLALIGWVVFAQAGASVGVP
jgi:hypothetical protein